MCGGSVLSLLHVLVEVVSTWYICTVLFIFYLRDIQVNIFGLQTRFVANAIYYLPLKHNRVSVDLYNGLYSFSHNAYVNSFININRHILKSIYFYALKIITRLRTNNTQGNIHAYPD